MDNLIGLVNQLQDAFTQVADAFPGSIDPASFQLPQIAVVGSQSTGKSSVLENFVGRDFLPRGTGIVTRRPLILQLMHDPQAEYGEFLHLANRPFDDFDAICREIRTETDRLTGSNKGISNVPIHLRLHSPHVLDLTLVDLPGMTRVPVGDQPADIEQQVRDMIHTYIANPNSLILAVSAANADLANSDALKLAREVDPSGDRTIGVLTKLDLMDDGTDAKDILDNKVYPLRYGFVGVVNRSQMDIENRKNIKLAQDAERRFFLGHSSYRPSADRMGTPYLQKMLNAHLTRHIAECLPALRAKLVRQSAELRRQLDAFKFDFDYDDPHWKPKALVLEVLKFSKRFRADMLGYSENALSTEQLSTGAHLRHYFHVKYPLSLSSVEITDEDILKREIGFLIQNIIGVRVGIFTPDKAFDHMIKNQIGKMEQPTQDLVDMIAESMLKSSNMNLEECSRFPMLAKELESLARCHIMRQVEDTRAEVLQLLAFENAYINARHEDFVGFSILDRTGGPVKGSRRVNPEKSVINKGYLALGGTGLVGRPRSYWFLLSCDALSWYTDDTEVERIYSVPIDESLKVIDTSDLRSHRFAIVDNKGRNVYKNHLRLELTAMNLEDLESWKVKLLNVGVYPKSADSDSANPQPEIEEDPHLKWQVETIFVLVDSYLQIVRRTLQDLVPKAIVHSLIRRSVDYFENSLVAEVSQHSRVDELMNENTAEIERKQKLQKMYTCCQQALAIIDRCELPKAKVLHSTPSNLTTSTSFSHSSTNKNHSKKNDHHSTTGGAAARSDRTKTLTVSGGKPQHPAPPARPPRPTLANSSQPPLRETTNGKMNRAGSVQSMSVDLLGDRNNSVTGSFRNLLKGGTNQRKSSAFEAQSSFYVD